jgi:putative transposase
VTDKLASCSAAKKELMPTIEHSTVQYENNGGYRFYTTKAHQPTRQQERQMRKFKFLFVAIDKLNVF